jgi:hypothetical protein
MIWEFSNCRNQRAHHLRHHYRRTGTCVQFVAVVPARRFAVLETKTPFVDEVVTGILPGARNRRRAPASEDSHTTEPRRARLRSPKFLLGLAVWDRSPVRFATINGARTVSLMYFLSCVIFFPPHPNSLDRKIARPHTASSVSGSALSASSVARRHTAISWSARSEVRSTSGKRFRFTPTR